MRGVLFLVLILLAMLLPESASAQYVPSRVLEDTLTIGLLNSQDSLLHQNLMEIVIMPPPKFKNKRHERRYNKLALDVMKIYPFLQVVRAEYDRVNKELQKVNGKKGQKYFMKDYQHYVYDLYIDTLKTFSVSQGRLFLKLIDRELGHSPYQLIKEYRGGWSAVMWQGMAFLAGANLRSEYDEEDNAMIEDIITRIDSGQL